MAMVVVVVMMPHTALMYMLHASAQRSKDGSSVQQAITQMHSVHHCSAQGSTRRPRQATHQNLSHHL
jgi:hypothetical protein